MKRKDFIKHLTANNCIVKREGANHTIYKNLLNGNTTTVPRHPEINDNLVKVICKQLEIPKAGKN